MFYFYGPISLHRILRNSLSNEHHQRIIKVVMGEVNDLNAEGYYIVIKVPMNPHFPRILLMRMVDGYSISHHPLHQFLFEGR